MVETCTNRNVWFDKNYNQVAVHELNKYYTSKFSLVKEKNMFDMKKDKWFIRTPTPEISEVVQLWLFEQGFKWQHFKDTKIHCTESKFLKLSPFEDDTFCHTDSIDPKYDKSKEIKLTFKTSVASVEYPVVETEAGKELKALEQKIQELTEQASKLRSVIK